VPAGVYHNLGADVDWSVSAGLHVTSSNLPALEDQRFGVSSGQDGSPLLDAGSAKCRYIPRPYMMQPTGSWNSNAASSRKEQNLSRFNT